MNPSAASFNTPVPVRAWMGGWLLMVAALHTLYACWAFRQPLNELLRHGVVNAVGKDPMIAAIAMS
jgi:Family of unknown function (DUF6463)